MARISTRKWAAGMVVVAIAATTMVGLSHFEEARQALARARLEASVLDEDITYLGVKLESDPYNYVLAGRLSDLHARRFRMSANMEDLHRSEELARSALVTHPDSAVGFGRLAQRLLTQHKFTEAFAAAQVALASDPGDEFALGVFVDAARAVGDYGAADSAFARIPSESLTALLRGGTPDGGNGRTVLRGLRSACARLDEIAQPLDTRAWCLAQLAGAEHDLHGPEGAELLLRRALSVHPGSREALEGLADLSYARGDWGRADRLYRRILTPAHPDLYLRLAEVARARGRSVEARDYEARFVELADAPGAEALNGLELATFLAGDPDLCRRARTLAADELVRRRSIEALEGSAWVERRCGAARSAVALLDEAEALGGLSPSGRLLRGLLQRSLGKVGDADTLTDVLESPTLLDPIALVTIREEGLDRSGPGGG